MINLATRPADMSWSDMRDQAGVLVKSGFLPKYLDTAEKALALILAGRELGVPTMAALRGVFISDGKVSMNAQLMLALAYRTQEMETFDVTQETADAAVVTVKRRGQPAITITFSDEDAKRAGLTGGFAWPKYPRIMRRWRAVTEALRLAFPDVLAGVYTPDELGVGYKVVGDDIELDVQTTSVVAKPNVTVEQPLPGHGLLAHEEVARLQNEFTKAVRTRGFDVQAVRAKFAAKYGRQPEDATIDQLNDAIELLSH